MPASTVRPGKAARKVSSLPMPFWKLTTIASGGANLRQRLGRLGGVARLDGDQDQRRHRPTACGSVLIVDILCLDMQMSAPR